MKHFFKNNALSFVFLLIFLLSWAGQAYTGWKDHNNEREEKHKLPIPFTEYIHTGHFIQATFENWESEFLQMGMFVILAVKLRQKGSSESKSFEEEEVDRVPDPRRKGAPWPVKKGGVALMLYKNSLSLVFFLLFAFSFTLHFIGSRDAHNEEQVEQGLPPVNAGEYISHAHFWFESFQNWQSEFLSVLSLVALSIYFRQYGSPQSKPVDAPHDETGT